MGTLLAFVLVSIGVLVLRRARPDLPRPFRTPWTPWVPVAAAAVCLLQMAVLPAADRKSTRLNSSHANISYAVFCLKKNNHLSSLLFFAALPSAYLPSLTLLSPQVSTTLYFFSPYTSVLILFTTPCHCMSHLAYIFF